MRAIATLGAGCLLGALLAVPAAAAPVAPETTCHGTRIDALAAEPADRLYGTWYVTQGTGAPLGSGERLHLEPAGGQRIAVTSRNRPARPAGGITLRLADPGQNVYRARYPSGPAAWKILAADTYGSALIVAECAPGVHRVLLLTATVRRTGLQRDFATDWWANHELTPKTLSQQDDPF